MNPAQVLSHLLRRFKTGSGPDIALTTSQQTRFATWEAGFDAHGRGRPITDAPGYRRGPNARWVEGWRASARMDELMAEQASNNQEQL